MEKDKIKEINNWLKQAEITHKKVSKDQCEKALDFAVKQVSSELGKFTDKFPNAYSEDGFYKPIDNVDWTNGFWTGEIWLAYEHCHDEKLKQSALIEVNSFLKRIQDKIQVDHHDMGFLYTPSCKAAYQLVGSEEGKKAALLAADNLIARFHKNGEFLQAWGAMDAPENYRLIIDCLLNVPLLYWATKETGNPKYREIGLKHTHTALKNVIREDGSTWHTFYFNSQTGQPDHGATCQGYRDGSAWARGQAWGIYGSALAYRYTGDEKYIEIFRKVLAYYLQHLPNDLVPYWDLEFGEGSKEPRDSSSAAITICGLMEMAGNLSEESAGDEAEVYKEIASQMMASLIENYAVKDSKESNGLVLHSTYSKHSPYNTCNHYGVDECNIWGDYFYMEALTRLTRKWESYW